MASKIALDSFLAVAKRSNLLSAEQLKSHCEAFERAGGDLTDARRFAEYLVKQRAVTSWQAEKLLQGKHKGFFLGKYKLLSLLGKGGMSSVYLAEHVLMRRRCAIKVLPTKRVHDTSYLGRFHREAQAVAALDDPHIVRAYDVDHEVDGDMEIHFLVMEYVDGKSLLDLVQDSGPLSPLEAADYVRQAASGLAHAHEAGLVHRDIKPGNLLVDKSGTVKLLDLGLARFFAGSEDVALTIQHDEKVLGTADYLSPEQAVDSHLVDARADIYSLGCTMYFLLTGHPPFTHGTLTQRLLAHQTKEPPGVETERSDVPESLLAILKQMMAKQPDNRYQSCDEVAATLVDWLREHGGADRVPDSDKGSGRRVQTAGSDTSVGSEADSGAVTGDSTSPSPVVARPPDEEPELGAFLAQLGGTAAAAEPPPQPARPQPPQPASPPSQPSRRRPKEKTASDSSRVRREQKSGRGKTAVSSPGASADDETVVHAEPVEEALPIAETADYAQQMATPTAETEVAESGSAGFPEPESVAEAVAIAEPFPEATVPRRRKNRNNGMLMGAAVGGGVILLAIIGYVVSQNQSGPGEQTLRPEEEFQTDGSVSETPGHADDLGPELRVGSDAEFPTISEAISYVEDHADRFGKDNPWVILVKGGETFDERLAIKSSSFGGFPEGARIASDGAPAVLRPRKGDGPVISLTNTTNVTIDGFLIDADGGDVGIQLSEYLLNSHLNNLQVVNFNRAGIVSQDATGLQGRPVRLTNLTFRDADAGAVGIQLEDMKDAEITDCRFVGPMRAGVELSTSTQTTHVTIRQCRFHDLQTGVLFTGVQPDLQSVAFINNTFHRIQRGVVFSEMPEAGSSGFEFKHNLFSEISGAEAVIEQGYDAQRAAELLTPDNAVNNWSERSADAAGAGELDIFATGGRRGIDAVTFASSDPEAGNFLQPTDQSLKSEVTRPAQGAAKYVGAVSP